MCFSDAPTLFSASRIFKPGSKERSLKDERLLYNRRIDPPEVVNARPTIEGHVAALRAFDGGTPLPAVPNPPKGLKNAVWAACVARGLRPEDLEAVQVEHDDGERALAAALVSLHDKCAAAIRESNAEPCHAAYMAALLINLADLAELPRLRVAIWSKDNRLLSGHQRVRRLAKRISKHARRTDI